MLPNTAPHVTTIIYLVNNLTTEQVVEVKKGLFSSLESLEVGPQSLVVQNVPSSILFSESLQMVCPRLISKRRY